MTAPTVIKLTERERHTIPAAELSDEIGEQLWHRFRDQVSVDFPTIKTNGEWWLTPQDWVGYIPVSEELGFSLAPKVPVANVFRMLEYAYRLDPLFPDGATQTGSLPEFYERLAKILARRVLDRARRGLYRCYIHERDDLPFVRGTVDVRRAVSRPWQVRLPCAYEEHTADVEENQLLAWTLYRIAHTGVCTERVRPTVRQAYRAVQGFTRLRPFHPSDCIDRMYNRLNLDYEPIHALCRFFLEQGGPVHESGDHTMLPFLINMSKLFEKFVFEWLRANLPKRFDVQDQKLVPIGRKNVLKLYIDLVVRDLETGATRCVVDTKYKQPESPDNADVFQITTYALAERCHDAFLVYPAPLDKPLDATIRDVRVRTVAFGLGEDLEEAGASLVGEILAS